MTAVPIPRNVQICANDELENEKQLFSVEDITKNLEKDFATPQVIQKHLSRLSCQAYVASTTFMKVYLRVRPFTEDEIRLQENQKCMEISEDFHNLTVKAPKSSNMFKNSSRGVGEAVHSFSFSKIFKEDTGQKDFFDSTALPIVQDFIEGRNSLLFTYGVTSSGKTYTIQGSPGNEGIMPRSVDVIFNSMGDKIIQDSDLYLESNNKVAIVDEKKKKEFMAEKLELMLLAEQINESEGIAKDSLDPHSREASVEPSSADTTLSKSSSRLSFLDFTRNVADDSIVDLSTQGPVQFVMFASFIEIYKDYIYDLLQPPPKGKSTKRQALKLAEDKYAPFVKGLRQVQVSSREEVFKLLTVARNHLHIAETKLNHNSSRSHCIFTIKSVCVTDTKKYHSAKITQISFCDLAGSERWGKTGSFGERLKEAGKINSSLMILGKCIETLRHNQQHTEHNHRMVPYRESRLTRLFQSFLMGKGRACMVVNASQCASMFDETYHVLKFSAIASEVRMEKNPARQSHKIQRRTSQEKLSMSVHNAMTRRDTHHRATGGWQPEQLPITEEGEKSDGASSDKEDGSEIAEETDVAFWQQREEKLLRMITMLKEAVREEKMNVFKKEVEVRREVTNEWTIQEEEINERWEERLEQQLHSVEQMGERKYNRTVDMANEQLRELREHNTLLEKNATDLDEDCEALDNRLEEQIQKNEALEKESKETLAKLQTEIDVFKMKIKEKDTEISELKRNVTRSRRSSTFEGRESFIESLQQANNDGREIIKEQLAEMAEMRSAVEEFSEENTKLTKQTKEKDAANQQLRDERDALSDELGAIKSELEQAKADLEGFKTTSGHFKQRSNDDINAMRGELDACKSSLEASQRELSAKAESCVQLEGELKAERGDGEKLKLELNEITANCEKQKAEVDKRELELREARRHLEDATRDLDAAKESRDAAERHNSALLSKNSEASAIEARQLRADLSLLGDEKSKLQFEVDELKCEETAKVSELQKRLAETEAALDKATSELTAADQKATRFAAMAEENKEIVVVEMSELKSEAAVLAAKNVDLTSTLEEALQCAELKSTEAERLEESLRQQREKWTALLQEEKDNSIRKMKEEKENNAHLLQEEKDKGVKLMDEMQVKIAKVERERDTAGKKFDKEHQKELLKIESKLAEEREDLMRARKEMDTASKLETQLIAEVDRLTTKLSEADKQQQSSKKVEEKRTSINAVLSQDVKILTTERDDLLQKTRDLAKELGEVKKELQNAEEQQPKMTVAEASEVEKMKLALKEMETFQDNQQAMLEKYEKGKVDKEMEIEQLNKNLATITEGKKTALAELKEMDKVLQREELLKAQLSKNEDRLKEMEEEVEKTNQSKEEELQKFREGRDRIASALESQINSQKSCNSLLKEKLDGQISANVQLKSENSRLKAEIQVAKNNAKTTLDKPRNMNKSISASAMLRPVKQEILSPDKSHVESPAPQSDDMIVAVHDMSTCMAGTPLRTPDVRVASEVREEKDQESADAKEQEMKQTDEAQVVAEEPEVVVKKEATENSQSDDEVPAKRRTRAPRKTSSRKPVVKKTSSRKKKSAPRPATPVASEFADDSRESRGFPKPEIEMDVTPVLKKSARGRKRTKGGSKDEATASTTAFDVLAASPKEIRSRLAKRFKTINDSVSLPGDTDLGKRTMRTRRGRKDTTEEAADDADTQSLNRFKNIGKVGDMLRNSPVAQTLKRIGTAISPSRSPTVISSPLNTGCPQTDQLRQSTRRVRKLHAEDISLPLESTPPDDHGLVSAIGRGVGVLSQTQNVPKPGTRRLRKRN